MYLVEISGYNSVLATTCIYIRIYYLSCVTFTARLC